MSNIVEAFMNQGWFQIAGEVVLMFTALTGAMPDRFVNKIPVLGKLWPIFNWLAGNIFNNVNHPKGMAALQEVEDELDKAKAEVKDRNGITDVLNGV